MPTCCKCGDNFPIWVEVDGVRRNLQRRKYCLVCSPRGGHNTKDLTQSEAPGSKRCQGACGKVLPESAFYRLKNGHLFSYCRLCDRLRQRDKCKAIKDQAVVYKGGKCMACGYDGCSAAMEFHHLDPDEKDFSVSSRKGTFDDAVRAELDKCVLLCCRCHREVHAGVRVSPTQP